MLLRTSALTEPTELCVQSFVNQAVVTYCFALLRKQSRLFAGIIKIRFGIVADDQLNTGMSAVLGIPWSLGQQVCQLRQTMLQPTSTTFTLMHTSEVKVELRRQQLVFTVLLTMEKMGCSTAHSISHLPVLCCQRSAIWLASAEADKITQ